MVAWIEFDQSKAIDSTKKKIGEIRLGHLPGGLRVAVEAIAESPEAYDIRIDRNADGDLTDETPISIKQDAQVQLNISRKSTNGQSVTLPYTLSYSRHAQGGETFYWRPAYMARGVVQIADCQAEIKALDANGDAVFDRADFRLATTIYVDEGTRETPINLNDPRITRRSDGSIEIPAELRASIKKKWLRGEEIVQLCGGSYLIDAIKPDGSALILAKTDLIVPKVGAALPELNLTTLDGKRIDLKGIRGNLTLLDFWASWCRPCVEKFPAVKRMVESYDGRLKVIAINVDQSDRLPMARNVIKEHGLTWPHVASGQGEMDPLWKMFGSMANNGLSIPLYVLIDSKGIIRYAGNGGEDLTELRAKVEEWKSSLTKKP